MAARRSAIDEMIEAGLVTHECRDQNFHFDELVSALKEAEEIRQKHEKRLQCRIIVTNIAASASKRELKNTFRRFKIPGRNILWNERDANGTRSASIEFNTEEAALEASNMTKGPME